MWHRILAILNARNREFYRDRAGLGWNVFMPVLMVMGFAFIFGGEPRAQFAIGLLGTEMATEGSPVLEIDHVDFVRVEDEARALVKVQRHQLDLLLDLRGAPAYWVNVHSPAGHLAERLVLGAYAPDDLTPQRRTVAGQALRYVDWVLPGVLAMNLMFSSLWGVGWVIVRYRKNGVLRRLQATPLSALEFLGAQVLSRLAVVLGANTAVYLGADLLLDFVMRGSYLTLFLVYLVGALCLISLGLIVAARLRTEELADGILNLMTWPMLLLSGVWFSLEGASPAARFLAQAFPLTHLVDAARSVMIDGAGVVDVLPQLALLGGIALVLLLVAARLFRWD
jgi:ABC-type multidrug transport system permease subunit